MWSILGVAKATIVMASNVTLAALLMLMPVMSPNQHCCQSCHLISNVDVNAGGSKEQTDDLSVTIV
jgi:hypothetical protein